VDKEEEEEEEGVGGGREEGEGREEEGEAHFFLGLLTSVHMFYMLVTKTSSECTYCLMADQLCTVLGARRPRKNPDPGSGSIVLAGGQEGGGGGRN
jgi:hypothetical protein